MVEVTLLRSILPQGSVASRPAYALEPQESCSRIFVWVEDFKLHGECGDNTLEKDGVVTRPDRPGAAGKY